MKNVLVTASIVAALASPLAAQSVPLNTVSGGEGQEIATGQAGAALAGSLGAGGFVIAAAVAAVVAAAEGGTTATTAAE